MSSQDVENLECFGVVANPAFFYNLQIVLVDSTYFNYQVATLQRPGAWSCSWLSWLQGAVLATCGIACRLMCCRTPVFHYDGNHLSDLAEGHVLYCLPACLPASQPNSFSARSLWALVQDCECRSGYKFVAAQHAGSLARCEAVRHVDVKLIVPTVVLGFLALATIAVLCGLLLHHKVLPAAVAANRAKGPPGQPRAHS